MDVWRLFQKIKSERMSLIILQVMKEIDVENSESNEAGGV